MLNVLMTLCRLSWCRHDTQSTCRIITQCVIFSLKKSNEICFTFKCADYRLKNVIPHKLMHNANGVRHNVLICICRFTTDKYIAIELMMWISKSIYRTKANVTNGREIWFWFFFSFMCPVHMHAQIEHTVFIWMVQSWACGNVISFDFHGSKCKKMSLNNRMKFRMEKF